MPSGLGADAAEIWCCQDLQKLVYNVVHHGSFDMLSMCLEFHAIQVLKHSGVTARSPIVFNGKTSCHSLYSFNLRYVGIG